MAAQSNYTSWSEAWEFQETTSLPWYINSAPRGNESFTGTNITRSELRETLKEIRESIELKDQKNYVNQRVSVGGKDHWLSSALPIESLVSEQGLCQRADVLVRFSCRERCGETPETRAIPVRCGCGQDCFLFGDCCEDLNTAQMFLPLP